MTVITEGNSVPKISQKSVIDRVYNIIFIHLYTFTYPYNTETLYLSNLERIFAPVICDSRRK